MRYWGNWMLERAREELAQFYPPDPDGSVPVAYLWSRTVPCPNCGAEMPLIRQYWLARKEKKKVALKPVLDRVNNRVDFEVVEGDNVTGDPAEATTSRGDTVCLLCRQVVKAEYVRQAGRDGKMGAVMTAVVLEASGGGGKCYRVSVDDDLAVYRAAERALDRARDADGLSAVPSEPVTRDARNVWCYIYGLDTFGKLFNPRQLLALTTLARLVQEAHAGILRSHLDVAYGEALATYMAFTLDRWANNNSTLTRLMAAGARGIIGTFARQALPMVWDYAEANPFGTSASWSSALPGIIDPLSAPVSQRIPTVRSNNARWEHATADLVLTDPLLRRRELRGAG